LKHASRRHNYAVAISKTVFIYIYSHGRTWGGDFQGSAIHQMNPFLL